VTSATTNGNRTNGAVRLPDGQNPLHWLTPEQIEEIGRELDELHEQVKADLGERDATYIRSMIAFQRRLALIGRGALIFSRRSSRTWRSATTSCTASGTG
jgi:hypothetical protein